MRAKTAAFVLLLASSLALGQRFGIEFRADSLYMDPAIEIEVPYSSQFTWLVGASFTFHDGFSGSYALANRYYLSPTQTGLYSGTRFYLTQTGTWFGFVLGGKGFFFPKIPGFTAGFEIGALARVSGEDPAFLQLLLGANIGLRYPLFAP